MKIEIESTERIVEFNGAPARLWKGHTESGIPIYCYVVGLSPDKFDSLAEFENELKEQWMSSSDNAYSVRMAM